MVFWLQLAREIHFPAGDVAMHVDTARHYHHTTNINTTGFRRHIGDYLPILYAYVLYTAVNVVGRIMNFAVNDAK
jgi:hypothetical protein